MLEQVGHGADVVLVAVREDDRLHVVEPVEDGLEVREDEVDARLVVLREEHTAVDDEQLALVLEDRHVAADLAETTERDDAQRALVEGRRELQVRVRVAHAAAPIPEAARPSRRISRCSGVPST